MFNFLSLSPDLFSSNTNDFRYIIERDPGIFERARFVLVDFVEFVLNTSAVFDFELLRNEFAVCVNDHRFSRHQSHFNVYSYGTLFHMNSVYARSY